MNENLNYPPIPKNPNISIEDNYKQLSHGEKIVHGIQSLEKVMTNEDLDKVEIAMSAFNTPEDKANFLEEVIAQHKNPDNFQETIKNLEENEHEKDTDLANELRQRLYGNNTENENNENNTENGDGNNENNTENGNENNENNTENGNENNENNTENGNRNENGNENNSEKLPDKVNKLISKIYFPDDPLKTINNFNNIETFLSEDYIKDIKIEDLTSFKNSVLNNLSINILSMGSIPGTRGIDRNIASKLASPLLKLSENNFFEVTLGLSMQKDLKNTYLEFINYPQKSAFEYFHQNIGVATMGTDSDGNTILVPVVEHLLLFKQLKEAIELTKKEGFLSNDEISELENKYQKLRDRYGTPENDPDNIEDTEDAEDAEDADNNTETNKIDLLRKTFEIDKINLATKMYKDYILENNIKIDLPENEFENKKRTKRAAIEKLLQEYLNENKITQKEFNTLINRIDKAEIEAEKKWNEDNQEYQDIKKTGNDINNGYKDTTELANINDIKDLIDRNIKIRDIIEKLKSRENVGDEKERNKTKKLIEQYESEYYSNKETIQNNIDTDAKDLISNNNTIPDSLLEAKAKQQKLDFEYQNHKDDFIKSVIIPDIQSQSYEFIKKTKENILFNGALDSYSEYKDSINKKIDKAIEKYKYDISPEKRKELEKELEELFYKEMKSNLDKTSKEDFSKNKWIGWFKKKHAEGSMSMAHRLDKAGINPKHISTAGKWIGYGAGAVGGAYVGYLAVKWYLIVGGAWAGLKAGFKEAKNVFNSKDEFKL